MTNSVTYASTFASQFVTDAEPKFREELNARFASRGTKWDVKLTVMPGRKFDRVVQQSWIVGSGERSPQKFVHCFIERATGAVFKPAGWTGPAKGVRYASVSEAVAAADCHGGYLYAR